MEKTVAFKSDGDDRTLHHTARAAREAEFDRLVRTIFEKMGNCGFNDGWAKGARDFACNLRCGVYPPAGDAFIAAAKYLEQHRGVMTGATLDPEERGDAA